MMLLWKKKLHEFKFNIFCKENLLNNKVLKFLSVIKWHILFCIAVFSLLYITKNMLKDLSVSAIIDPILIAFLTTDIFYVFINKWPEFIKKKEMEVTIKDSLILILKKHESELLVFTEKKNLKEALQIIRSDINFHKTLKNRHFCDMLESVFGRQKIIEVLYSLRLEINEKIELILKVWSPHLSMSLLSLLWCIASDKSFYFEQPRLFIIFSKIYQDQKVDDSLDVLWERFHKTHVSFLSIVEICKSIYPQESYFNVWNE